MQLLLEWGCAYETADWMIHRLLCCDGCVCGSVSFSSVESSGGNVRGKFSFGVSLMLIYVSVCVMTSLSR